MRRLIPAASWLLVSVVLGVAGAFAWTRFADPGAYVVTERGAVLTEEAASQQFQVVVAFVAIGALVSLLLGGVLAVVLQRLGWLLTPVVLVLTTVAGVLTWRLGHWWGPDQPDAAAARGLAVGARLPLPLDIESAAVLLVWPVAGLVAVVLVTSCLPVDEEPLDEPYESLEPEPR